ncbi:S16 family serine protease [Bacillus sp. B-jedd]|uniref:S16 family serine protease n=1 Tax=Bacillus sp. B-jedd TaxID=1476857 RepID=UPI0018CCE38A|nr:S16 family serine protease [Bacillus sp. B-jedd]
MLGVNELAITDGTSKKEIEKLLTKQQVDVLSVIEVSNKIIYGSKNRQLLKWLHLQTDPLQQMEGIVTRYLGREDQWLTSFFKQPDIAGDSAGLSLALSGRLKQSDFRNHLKFAVTGAINKNGDVLPVRNIYEKMQITKKANIPYMIVPDKNAKEAAAVQNKLQTNFEIFYVSTVEEAVQVIQKLNEKNK